MSESTVSTTVAFLFGGMIFLLTYTRLGGLATTVLAGAILVVYLLIEAWHAWQARNRSSRDANTAARRWREWEKATIHRYIDWQFTPWPGGSASDEYPTEFSDVHVYRNADRWTRPGAIAQRERATRD